MSKLKVRLSLVFSVCLFAVSENLNADDWLQWRGPNGNGIASVDQKPPTKWNDSTNIVWQTKVPGRGHSSPTIVNGKIYLTTADKSKQSQSVLCFDQATGKPVWEQVIHSGKFVRKIHQKNTHASPTIASDGQSLFVFFNNNDRVFLTKLNLDGKQIWQEDAGPFRPYYAFGFASSPTIHGDVVLISAESEKVGFICAYNKNSGDEIWRQTRPKTSYSSPIVAKVNGREQVLLSGQSSVAGLNIKNGTELWKAPAKWQVSCGTMVWHDDLVYASGGYPQAQTLCVKADGSGEIVWQNNVKCYEQSMLYHNGYLFGISDAGIGYCWDAKKGTEMWKTRMEGPVSCSPILANGNIYYSSEKGTTFVFKASAEKFTLVSKNKLGNSAFATPSFCDNRIYTRIAKEENGIRQEYLVCIGE